jgi:hypothetical protein
VEVLFECSVAIGRRLKEAKAGENINPGTDAQETNSAKKKCRDFHHGISTFERGYARRSALHHPLRAKSVSVTARQAFPMKA